MNASAHTTAHKLQELQLRLDQEAMLAQCQCNPGVVGSSTAVPQAKGHVLLCQSTVQVAQRIKAAHVVGEQHNVALQHGDCNVPRVHVTAHVLDHLGRNFGLRLALADALQQRLPHCGAQCNCLARVVLLGQQLNDRLGQRRLHTHNAEQEAHRQVLEA